MEGLAFMLEYPHFANFTCSQCREWIFDLDTGKHVLRGGEPQRRHPAQPTPCVVCPRKSPANEDKTRLSARNLKTLVLFLRNRALFGRALTPDEAADSLLQKNFGLVDIVLRRWEQSHVADSLSATLAARFT